MSSQSQRRKRPAAEADTDADRGRTRKRNRIACDTCRARRTKCDNARPACSYCTSNDIQCNYETASQSSSAGIELELASINQKLSHIADTMAASTIKPAQTTSHSCQDFRNENFEVDKDTPFMLMGSGSMMREIGLDYDLPQLLLRIERSTHLPATCKSNSLIIHQQQALEALESFFEKVHFWYPLLRTGFTQQYLETITLGVTQSCSSCVVLLVAGIGFALKSKGDGQEPYQHLGESCLETALGSLPTMLSEYSLCSIQCLMLLALYYTCLLKPTQAHDYSLLASFKIQNLMKTNLPFNDSSFHSQLKQLLWIVLLLEDEIGSQFDTARSGMWDFSATAELPDGQHTWYLLPRVDEVSTRSTYPAESVQDVSSSKNTIHSCLLANIAVRRMLHRCNGAVERLPSGLQVYAPKVAAELELQLKQWYCHLPEVFRSDLQPFNINNAIPALSELKSFLQAQYYYCKISIYWPAIHQAIQNNQVDTSHHEYHSKFFESYIQLVPRLLVALNGCIVHTWTLFGYLFLTTMATVKAVKTPCLQSMCTSEVRKCFKTVYRTDRDLVRGSVSLAMIHDKMKKMLTAEFPEVLH